MIMLDTCSSLNIKMLDTVQRHRLYKPGRFVRLRRVEKCTIKVEAKLRFTRGSAIWQTRFEYPEEYTCWRDRKVKPFG